MSTGIPYLGSKISLISKSEIRYEGILYTIDTKESTVALAKVRSFGTEDRPTDRPVAPRDEVYEYIIFRAHDIKDLRVSEPPKPQSTLPGGLTNDPAIVQVPSFETTKHSLQHTAPPATGASFPAPSYSQPPPYGPVGTLPSYAPPQYQAQPQLPQSFVGGSQQSGSRSTTPTPTPGQRKSPTMDAGVQVSGPAPGENRSSPRSHSGGGSQAPVGSRRKPQQQPQGTQGRPQQQQQLQQQGSRSQQHHMAGAPGQAHPRGGGIGRRGGSGGGGRPRSAGYRTAKPKEQLKFDREYDFEQANAEFQELESKLAQTKISDEKKDDSGTETQVGDNHEDDDVVYYDKTKSFFDNISCEAIERSKGMQRIDWRQERKLNSETFGVAASNWMRRNAWRGRGGFWRGARGGRGRGGPQGARGGGRPRNGSIPGMPGMRMGPTQVPTRRTEKQPGDELH
ncbi:protein LSM14 homolog A-like isoform X2 [Ornithodoros turicata]|uniref:protein LSM14 homolog A-like isoform X2 n=1 Tax=Ornithodoros turicata TaxID=34597 RepID=UPI00313936A1